MNRGLAAVLLVALLLVPATPVAATNAVVVGGADLSLSVPDNRVSPGETTTLDVYVVNDARLVRGGPQEFVDRVTTARTTTIDVGEVRGVDVATGEVPVGRVPEGSHGPVGVELTVPESVPPGTYRLPVTLSYTYTSTVLYDVDDPSNDPEYDDVERTRRVSIPVVVEEHPRFRIVGVGTDAQVGGSGTMTVSVRHVGSEAVREASVDLTSANDDLTFGGAATAESFVGEWVPGETKTATFPVSVVEDAELRNYTVTGRVSYTDADGIAGASNELRSSVRPLAEQAFSLSGVESSLRVDHEGAVSGTVTNEGPLPITDAVVVFEPASPNFDAGETEFAVPDLAPGESAPFAFDVEVSSAADPGSRQLRFVVDYETEDGDDRTSDALTARIDVASERDPFAVEVTESTVRAGGSGRLALRVTNADDETLSDVSAKLFVDDPISTDDDEAFVDELAPGESAEISFEVSVGGGTFPKAYPVSLDFEYDRSDGTTEISDTVRLPVTVEERRGGGLPFGLAVGLGAVALVGAVIVVVRRR
ncbi:COG1361 S-layer family protein [Haloplanus halophilus]|uniref:COG1361 S-layer family protein n=1 Tax=Haloplanus halophilus TaxID=2949993 RepID=UPI00203BA304|nr:COG1361 S-layer family protein [Haloplanus sp. GDY1]